MRRRLDVLGVASRTVRSSRGQELRLLVGKLVNSNKLRTGGAFIAAAVAFAAANLLFADHLPPATYGIVALSVAIIGVGSPLAPLGLGIMVVRQHLPAEPRLLFQCAATSALVAIGAAAIGGLAYRLGASEMLIILVTVAGGGFIRLASAILQSEERFVTSTLVSESLNYLLLFAALLTIVTGIATAVWPLAVVAIAQLVLVFVVWKPLLAAGRHADRPPTELRLSEMILLTGTNAANLVQLQLERFAIPMFLDIETLAAFAVLAVFTIAPFRPIEFGTYRTLLPRLRRAGTGAERGRLFFRELAQTSLLLLALGLVLMIVTPLVLGYMFAGKYHFNLGTVLAGIAGGQLRVLRILVSAAIAALADRRGLAIWNAAAWFSVGAAFLGGWVGSAWGLDGFLCGVVLGGLTNIVLTVPIVWPHLR